jgi:hypothetical protein
VTLLTAAPTTQPTEAPASMFGSVERSPSSH